MISEATVQEWLEGKDLRRADMTTDRYPYWLKHLSEYRDQFCFILEIGSFEGQSALFWLNFFPKAQVTCIDWFKGSREHDNEEARSWFIDLEKRFDANTRGFNGRLYKMVSASVPALWELQRNGCMYDLIYIDGSHDRDDVMVDTCLAWPMLDAGGFMIWDDYNYNWPAQHNPRPAIDCFMAMHHGEYEEIQDTGRQKWVRKTVAT